jgi:hypothetical protein
MRAFSTVAFKSLLNNLWYHLCIIFLSVMYICNIWSFKSIPPLCFHDSLLHWLASVLPFP